MYIIIPSRTCPRLHRVQLVSGIKHFAGNNVIPATCYFYPNRYFQFYNVKTIFYGLYCRNHTLFLQYRNHVL